jgi:hypothetical protein
MHKVLLLDCFREYSPISIKQRTHCACCDHITYAWFQSTELVLQIYDANVKECRETDFLCDGMAAGIVLLESWLLWGKRSGQIVIQSLDLSA